MVTVKILQARVWIQRLHTIIITVPSRDNARCSPNTEMNKLSRVVSLLIQIIQLQHLLREEDHLIISYSEEVDIASIFVATQRH